MLLSSTVVLILVHLLSPINGLINCDTWRVKLPVRTVMYRYPKSRSMTQPRNCSTTIRGIDVKVISLTVRNLSIPHSPDCHDGALSVFSPSDELLAKYCGNVAPLTEEFNQSSIRLEFQVHTTHVQSGFTIEYQLNPGIVRKLPRYYPGMRTPSVAAARAETADVTTCGKTSVPIWVTNNRYIRTARVQSGSWPWIASLQLPLNNVDTHFCAASLIDQHWLVTSARCFRDELPSGEKALDLIDKIVVRLGAHNLSVQAETEQHLSIDKVIVHPEYDLSVKHNNDIALIKLKSAVNFTGAVHAICLPGLKEPFPNRTSVYVAGWHRDIALANESYADTLSSSRMVLVFQDTCKIIYKELLGSNMLCVGVPLSSGNITCQGDRGAPLIRVRYGDGIKVLAGVVSWGKVCGEVSTPAVYTRLDRYLEWIHNHLSAD